MHSSNFASILQLSQLLRGSMRDRTPAKQSYLYLIIQLYRDIQIYCMAQEEEFTMKVIKDSSTGFFSNERLLFIKAGIIAYYSKIPKKYVGNVRSLQLSGQLPKFTISAADLENVECKDSLLILYFKKSKLVDREDMRRMVEGEGSLRGKPPLNEDIEKWVFRCGNLEQARYFYKQIRIHRDGDHKPQIANAIDGYRSAQKSHRQLSMLPMRDKLTPMIRMSQIPKSAMDTTQSNREGKPSLKQMSRSPSKKQIEDIMMKSPEKKAFLKKSPNRSIEKRNESPKDIKWIRGRKGGEESVLANTIMHTNEQEELKMQERDVEESTKKNQHEMNEMQTKENERKKQLRENQQLKIEVQKEEDALRRDEHKKREKEEMERRQEVEKKKLILQQQILEKRELDSNRQRLIKEQEQRNIKQLQRVKEEAQKKEEVLKKEKEIKDKQKKEEQMREKEKKEKEAKEIQIIEKQRKEKEMKEIEMKEIEMKEKEKERQRKKIQRKEIQRKEIQRKEIQRKERQRKEIQRKEIQRKEIQRKEIQRKEIQKKEIQRKEIQRKEIQKKERQRKEIQRKEIQRKEIQRKEIQRKEIQRKERQRKEIQRKEIQRKERQRKEIQMKEIELNFSSPPPSAPPKQATVSLKPSAYRTSLPLQLVMEMIQEEPSERSSQQKQGDLLEVQLGPKDVNELLSVDIQKKYRIDNQLVDLIRVASYTRTLAEIENIFKIPQQILTSLEISPPHRITFSKEGKAQFVEAQFVEAQFVEAQFVEAQFVEAEEQEDIIPTFGECRTANQLNLIPQQDKPILHKTNANQSKNVSIPPQKEEEDIMGMRHAEIKQEKQTQEKKDRLGELKKERESAYSRVSLAYSRMSQLQVNVRRRVKQIEEYHPIQMDSTVDLRGVINYRGSIPSSVTEQLAQLQMERVACTPLIEFITRVIDEMPCYNKLIEIGFQDYTIRMSCVGRHHSGYSAMVHLRRVLRRVSGLVGLRLEMREVLYMEYKHYKCLCRKECDSLPLQSYKCLQFLYNHLNSFRTAFPDYQVQATRVSPNHYQLTCAMDPNQASLDPNQCGTSPNQCGTSPTDGVPKQIKDHCQAVIKTMNRVDQESTLKLVDQMKAQHNNIGVYALSRILHFKMDGASLVFQPIVQFMNISLMQPLSEKLMRGDQADAKECLHCLLLYLQKMHPYQCNENVVQVCLQIGEASWLEDGTAAEMLLLRVLQLTSQFSLSRYEAYILLIKLYLVRLSQQQEHESQVANKLIDIYQNCGLYLRRMFKSELNIYSLGFIKLGAVLKSELERQEIYQRYIIEITEQIQKSQREEAKKTSMKGMSGINGLNASHQLLDMLIEFKISLSYTYLRAGKTYLAYLKTKQLMATLQRGVSSHYIDCVVLIAKAWLHLQTNYLNLEGRVTKHDRTQLQPSDTAYVQQKIYRLVDILIKRRDIAKIKEVFKLAIKISEKCERSEEKKIRLYGKLKEGGKNVAALAQYLEQLLGEEQDQLRIRLRAVRSKVMGNVFQT